MIITLYLVFNNNNNNNNNNNIMIITRCTKLPRNEKKIVYNKFGDEMRQKKRKIKINNNFDEEQQIFRRLGIIVYNVNQFVA